MRHRNEDAGVVQILFVGWPADALLITLLCAWTFLERKSREEQQEACQEDEADTAGVECCVGAVAGWDVTIARRRDGNDVDG